MCVCTYIAACFLLLIRSDGELMCHVWYLSACAALPKERQRYSKKCKELVITIEQRVLQYNTLVQEYNRGVQLGSASSGARLRCTTTAEAVRKQQFCWIDEYSRTFACWQACLGGWGCFLL